MAASNDEILAHQETYKSWLLSHRLYLSNLSTDPRGHG